MKILVTGEKGQLAQSLALVAQQYRQLDFEFTRRNQLDLQIPAAIPALIDRYRPDVIINAAAWTEVDLAEDHMDEAFRANGEAAGVLARSAKNIGARLIQLSTDYVYDGSKPLPYVESDATKPLNTYGASKLAGENAVRAQMDEFLILRTSWVISPFGKNFVKTMLHLAESRDTLNVVNDQFGNPTSALDLARAIISILQLWQSGDKTGLGEAYHCTGRGITNWAGLATHVFGVSKKLGGPTALVSGIPASQWPTKAKRPANSSLDCSKLGRDFSITMPKWQDSVETIVESLLKA